MLHHSIAYNKSVQLPTSAVNVALPLVLRFAAACRAAAPCCCGAGRAAIDRYLLPTGPKQQTRHTLLQRANGADRQTDRQTDTVPLHRPCYAYYASSTSNY